jgi:hypothetical protein
MTTHPPTKQQPPQEKFSAEDYERNRSLFLRMAGWLMLFLSLLTAAWYGFIFIRYGQFNLALANSALGILAFLLLRARKGFGVFLASVWSLAQFVAVQVGTFVLDFVQVVSIHLPLENPLASGDLVRIKVNFLAILLFAVFVMNADAFSRKKHPPQPAGKR